MLHSFQHSRLLRILANQHRASSRVMSPTTTMSHDIHSRHHRRRMLMLFMRMMRECNFICSISSPDSSAPDVFELTWSWVTAQCHCVTVLYATQHVYGAQSKYTLDLRMYMCVCIWLYAPAHATWIPTMKSGFWVHTRTSKVRAQLSRYMSIWLWLRRCPRLQWLCQTQKIAGVEETAFIYTVVVLSNVIFFCRLRVRYVSFEFTVVHSIHYFHSIHKLVHTNIESTTTNAMLFAIERIQICTHACVAHLQPTAFDDSSQTQRNTMGVRRVWANKHRVYVGKVAQNMLYADAVVVLPPSSSSRAKGPSWKEHGLYLRRFNYVFIGYLGKCGGLTATGGGAWEPERNVFTMCTTIRNGLDVRAWQMFGCGGGVGGRGCRLWVILIKTLAKL